MCSIADGAVLVFISASHCLLVETRTDAFLKNQSMCGHRSRNLKAGNYNNCVIVIAWENEQSHRAYY